MKSVERFFENMDYKKDLEEMCYNFSRIYGQEAEKWFLELNLLLQKICKKWKLEELSLLSGASLGIIISCYTKVYNKKVVIKIIPAFINRFEQEWMAYTMLSKEYMCKLLDYDIENKILMLEMIEPAMPFIYKQDKSKLEIFFRCIFQNTKVYTGEDGVESYWDLYERMRRLAQKSSYILEYREKCNARTNYIKNKYFGKDELYYMHGDLHSGNVIKKGDAFIAIDPLGFCAPKEFIFVRFAIFQLVFAENKKEALSEIEQFLKAYINVKKFYMALIIDTDLAILTGIVQLNDEYEMVNRFINVMDFLEKIVIGYDDFK